ncbi:MAG: MaoC/PaaZ C-terminal domain-containing protein [Acidimicrobiales bacterium]|jgi:acyl dehydratase
MDSFVPWSIIARNLPEHARNPIHTDAGAQAAGFGRALVAGVTSYAYCCHPVIERFGLDWVASGEAEVRFVSPVADGDELFFRVAGRSDGGLDVTATSAPGGAPAVTLSAWRGHRTSFRPQTGEALTPVAARLEGEYGSDYAARAGDAQPDCAVAGVVHPAVWPALANSVFHSQLARGSWIHVRSGIRHFGLAPAGAEAEVSTVVVRRFQRRGERAVAEVIIRVDGAIVAVLEHEAIVDVGH